MANGAIDVKRLEQAKATLRRLGLSLPEFARRAGVNYHVARRVMRGELKGYRGDAHKVAVLLGLKEGEILDENAPLAEQLKRARQEEAA